MESSLELLVGLGVVTFWVGVWVVLSGRMLDSTNDRIDKLEDRLNTLNGVLMHDILDDEFHMCRDCMESIEDDEEDEEC